MKFKTGLCALVQQLRFVDQKAIMKQLLGKLGLTFGKVISAGHLAKSRAWYATRASAEYELARVTRRRRSGATSLRSRYTLCKSYTESLAGIGVGTRIAPGKYLSASHLVALKFARTPPTADDGDSDQPLPLVFRIVVTFRGWGQGLLFVLRLFHKAEDSRQPHIAHQMQWLVKIGFSYNILYTGLPQHTDH